MEGKERKDNWVRDYLIAGLIVTEGHQEHAAEYLGISSRTLRNWLGKWPDIKDKFANSKTDKETNENQM